MNEMKLAGLEPASVFEYFEQLCAIPHGSGNTRAISDYLVGFAKEHGLRYTQDDANNVVIFQDGTCGYEDHAPVIIQGHMDMVCEKDADCPIDMASQGLDIAHDGQYVYAKGTTLGGDDGIAIAFALALMADTTIPHPPLEVIITVDEEIGMLGAAVIDLKDLKGRTLINIDSEEEASSPFPAPAAQRPPCLWQGNAVRSTAPASVWLWTASRAVIPAWRSTRTGPMPTRSWANL